MNWLPALLLRRIQLSWFCFTCYQSSCWFAASETSTAGSAIIASSPISFVPLGLYTCMHWTHWVYTELVYVYLSVCVYTYIYWTFICIHVADREEVTVYIQTAFFTMVFLSTLRSSPVTLIHKTFHLGN